MQHLDDGQLHAYLDGELVGERAELERHAGECAECRGRLEAARRLRARARDVLDASGPANIVPLPFEQLTRRARGRWHETRPPTRVILAWAASLAVAVTAGWYARGRLFAGPTAPPATQLARGQSVDARLPAEPEPAPPPAQAAQAKSATQVARAADTPAHPAGATNVPVTASVDALQPSSTGVAAAPPGTAGVVGRQANIASAQAPAAEAVAAPAPAAPRREAARSAPGTTLLKVTDAETGAAVSRWTTISRSAAEERLGGRIATVPGLPLLGHAISGTGQSAVVRTIQVLGPGSTIELYQQRAGTTKERRVVPGAASLTVDWQGYTVTGTAAVPTDSLRRLLARLQP